MDLTDPSQQAKTNESDESPAADAAADSTQSLDSVQSLETVQSFESAQSLEAVLDAEPSLDSTQSLDAAQHASMEPIARPSYLFFGCVTAISLFADISTKVWAEIVINERGFEPIKVIGENLSVTLAYNQGGAWGLFATADEMIRKPFFLGVSGFALFFIISLYARLSASQKALKWGLPLVLGGALGNLNDRITRSQVIDFIDYRADWVLSLNRFINDRVSSWTVTDHWPTFNIADVAICVGVVLMGVDMFTHRPRALSRPDERVDETSLGSVSEGEAGAGPASAPGPVSP